MMIVIVGVVVMLVPRASSCVPSVLSIAIEPKVRYDSTMRVSDSTLRVYHSGDSISIAVSARGMLPYCSDWIALTEVMASDN